LSAGTYNFNSIDCDSSANFVVDSGPVILNGGGVGSSGFALNFQDGVSINGICNIKVTLISYLFIFKIGASLSKKTHTLPLSATRPALLSGTSDHSFRELLYNFFTVSNRLELVRRHLGSRIGLSGPQYNLMMAVAELQGSTGVSVGRVAEYLHVSGTFITAETAKLARKRYINKRHGPRDMRVSLLVIGEKGWIALGSLFPELQQINDLFFAIDSRKEFENLHRTLKRMVESSQRTLALISAAVSENRPRLLALVTQIDDMMERPQ
jgi:MarR family transcriptional regulator, organic hydroperoxide resistance regulator